MWKVGRELSLKNPSGNWRLERRRVLLTKDPIVKG